MLLFFRSSDFKEKKILIAYNAEILTIVDFYYYLLGIDDKCKNLLKVFSKLRFNRIKNVAQYQVFDAIKGLAGTGNAEIKLFCV